MAPFTSEHAAKHGRRGGRRSHQHKEAQYADFVLPNRSAVEQVAHRIRQGRQLVIVLHTARLVNQMHEGGR